MNVAIIILNWNGKKLLEQFLPSVVKFSNQASIYIADNASTDNSIAFVTEKYPHITIIKNKENGGYAKGYNDALTHLTEDLFVLLNSDIEVTENWLSPIVSEFKKDNKMMAAQPKILDYNNKDYFEYAGAAGGYIDQMGYPYCRGRVFNFLEKDTGQYNDIIPIFWASGACFFIKREAFWKVGGLDEDFFAHQEEIDLCWRLQSKGGQIKYISNSLVYHVGGATLTIDNPEKTFYNFRNSLLMLVKNVKGIEVWWIIFKRMLLDGVAAFQYLAQRKPSHFFSIVKAHYSFYRLLPKFLKKRKKWATHLNYFTIKSIAFRFFILKKRNFNTL